MSHAKAWIITMPVIVVFLPAMWSAGHFGVQAQSKMPAAVIKRIYTGSDGLSHVENLPLDANSILETISGIEVRVGKPGNFNDWHVGPQRQYIINLAGSG